MCCYTKELRNHGGQRLNMPNLIKHHQRRFAYHRVDQWAQEYGKGLADMLDFYGVEEFLDMCGLQHAKISDVNGDALRYAVDEGVTWEKFAENNAEQIYGDFDVEKELKPESSDPRQDLIAGDAMAHDEEKREADDA